MNQDKNTEIKLPQQLIDQNNVPLMQNELYIGLLFLFGLMVIGGSFLGKK